MSVVVTGATGLIGRALVGEFSRAGVNVVAVGGPTNRVKLEGPRIQWVEFNRDAEVVGSQVACFAPEVVVHCANHYILHPQASEVDELFEANVRFPLSIVRKLLDEDILVVNLGTFFQYQGPNHKSPNSVYAETKQELLNVLSDLAVNNRLKLCDLTLYDTYGPADTRRKLIPLLLSAALAGEQLVIRSQDALMNILYLDDIVKAIMNVVEHRQSGRWALFADQNVTVRDLVSLVEHVTAMSICSSFGNDIPQYSPYLDVAPRPPRWTPVTSLRDGLQQCWNAIRAKS